MLFNGESESACDSICINNALAYCIEELSTCPDFEFCIVKPDPNVPVYDVMLTFTGTLNITRFNALVRIADDPAQPGLSTAQNVVAFNVHPAFAGFNLNYNTNLPNTKVIRLRRNNVSPTISLSGSPITVFSFTYTGDVGDCFQTYLHKGEMRFKGSPDICESICDEASANQGILCCIEAAAGDLYDNVQFEDSNKSIEATVANQVTDKIVCMPNPFSDELNLSFTVPTAGEGVVSVYDYTGKLVASYQAIFEKGTNTFQVKNTSNLPSGILFFNIVTKGQTLSSRGIKQ